MSFSLRTIPVSGLTGTGLTRLNTVENDGISVLSTCSNLNFGNRVDRVTALFNGVYVSGSTVQIVGCRLV